MSHADRPTPDRLSLPFRDDTHPTFTLKWHQFGVIDLLLGSLLYLVDTFLVTIANVLLNAALAKVNPDRLESVDLWAKYLTGRFETIIPFPVVVSIQHF